MLGLDIEFGLGIINVTVRVWVRSRVGVRARLAIFLFLRHVTPASASKLFEVTWRMEHAWLNKQRFQ